MTWFAGIGLKLLGFGKGIGSWWNGLSPKAHQAIIIVALVLVGFVLHQHFMHKALDAAEQAGEAKAYANVATKAKKLADQANALTARTATLLRSQTNAQSTRVDVQYRNVLVRGPGAAACTSVAGFPTGAGGSQSPASATGSAVDPVSPEGGSELIALPFTGAATMAGNYDQLLVDDQALRTAWATYSKQWQDWNVAAAKARAQP